MNTISHLLAQTDCRDSADKTGRSCLPLMAARIARALRYSFGSDKSSLDGDLPRLSTFRTMRRAGWLLRASPAARHPNAIERIVQ